MDLYQTLYEQIDMRSFSNLWFWIALAVMWSSVSHWVLGVPYDLVLRARRRGGAAQEDLEDIVRINTNRLLHIGREAGLWVLAIACFVLTTLAVTGFVYGFEFAQAVFCLMFPGALVGMMSLSTARRIQDEGASGDLLFKRLARHRFYTQLIGMVAIFCTAMWGMYQNFQGSPLG
ncbi:component of SufBCD complex [Shimia biformata]|uniref:component of SufBCD complex n=1 Tax=Shimia biformata TaxID=1294299 RepID=UPI001950616D|nr:component of SufBCD complex [Shimia biformata]